MATLQMLCCSPELRKPKSQASCCPGLGKQMARKGLRDYWESSHHQLSSAHEWWTARWTARWTAQYPWATQWATQWAWETQWS